MYATRAQVLAGIPANLILKALDSDRDGTEDADVMDAVLADASEEVDGALAGVVAVPFSSPYPAVAVQAAKVFAREALYRRAEYADAKNPYSSPANAMRDRLAAIARGEQPLAAPAITATGVADPTTVFDAASQDGL